MTDEQRPAPASDGEVASLNSLRCDCEYSSGGRDRHYRNCPSVVGPKVVARIDQQRETIQAQADRIRVLEAEVVTHTVNMCKDAETIAALQARADKAEAEAERLREAVTAFLSKWEMVNPHIIAAFAFRQNHLGRYQGPTIEAELTNLRAALAHSEPGSRKE